jgi:exonuclease VII small subunit
MAANPNQAIIDQMTSAVNALDAGEAQLDAAVIAYQANLAAAQQAADAACAQAQQAVADATAATNAAIAAAKAQKATYETQEAGLRAAIAALGG